MKNTFLKAAFIIVACGVLSASHTAKAEQARAVPGHRDVAFAKTEEKEVKRYIVKISDKKVYSQSSGAMEIEDSPKAHGVETARRIPGGWHSLSGRGLDRQDAARWAGKSGRLEYIEEDHKRHKASSRSGQGLFASSWDYNWGIYSSGLDTAAAEVDCGSSDRVVVAVLDTGVWEEHPLISGRTTSGYDFVDEDFDASDTDGHGTHVAGIVASATSGLAVDIMPVRVMDSDGGYDSDIGRGIRYAADSGADIINMSLTGSGRSLYLEEAVDYAVSRGALVVVAAGNYSSDTSLYYPAGIDECVTVSASAMDDHLADFSNYGSEVDLSAPGVDIFSATTMQADDYGLKDGYKIESGTSMASPLAAAAAAIMKLDNPDLLPYELELMLASNTRDAGPAGRDESFGYGIVDLSGWISSSRISVKGKIELAQGPKKIFDKSEFLIKYTAPEGHTPDIWVGSGDERLECEVSHPLEGVARIRMDGAIAQDEVTIHVGKYSYGAVVEKQWQEFSFTSESEIIITIDPVKTMGQIHSENLYIRGPGGCVEEFESISVDEGVITARLAEGGPCQGRCSIVVGSQIVPAAKLASR